MGTPGVSGSGDASIQIRNTAWAVDNGIIDIENLPDGLRQKVSIFMQANGMGDQSNTTPYSFDLAAADTNNFFTPTNIDYGAYGIDTSNTGNWWSKIFGGNTQQVPDTQSAVESTSQAQGYDYSNFSSDFKFDSAQYDKMELPELKDLLSTKQDELSKLQSGESGELQTLGSKMQDAKKKVYEFEGDFNNPPTKDGQSTALDDYKAAEAKLDGDGNGAGLNGQIIAKQQELVQKQQQLTQVNSQAASLQNTDTNLSAQGSADAASAQQNVQAGMSEAATQQSSLQSEVDKLQQEIDELLKQQKEAEEERKEAYDALKEQNGEDSEFIKALDEYDEARTNFGKADAAQRDNSVAIAKVEKEIQEIQVAIDKKEQGERLSGDNADEEISNISERNYVLELRKDKYEREAASQGLEGDAAKEYVNDKLTKDGFTEEQINQDS